MNGCLGCCHRYLRYVLLGTLLGLLAACASTSNNLAPVTDGWNDTRAASQTYRVQSDDTLYSIAFRYGLDYRQLASSNNIAPPYHITVGQTLVLSPEADDTLTTSAAPAADNTISPVITAGAPATVVSSQPSTASPAAASTTAQALTTTATAASNNVPPPVVPAGPVSKWIWPAQGRVIHTFSNSYGGNKGIDIAGSLGQPVKATAAGRVVYCGTGLRGYGLLIIIKHNSEFLSAYAHNSKALIKEGDNVKAGQTIASMGNSDASQVVLHFEIRRAGKPVDPLSYLSTT